MRVRLPGGWMGLALLLSLGALPAFSASIVCEPVGSLWTPHGVYTDQGLGLRYRAESREYRCTVAGGQDVRVEDSREVFLDLPEGVRLLRYPAGTLVLFVGERAGEAGRGFAESLLDRGEVDLLLIHEGVRLRPEAVRRARLVLRLKPGAYALSLAGEGFPLYRLTTILGEFDIGLTRPRSP